MLSAKNKNNLHYWRVMLGSWITITYFIAFYIANLVIARQLNSAADYGDFSVAISVMLLLGITFLLGQNQFVLQIVPQYEKKKDYGLLKGYFKFIIFLFFSAIIISVFISIIYISVYKFSYPSILTHPIWVGILFAPSVFAALFLISLITVRGRYLTSVVAFRAIFPIFMLLLILIFSHLHLISSVLFTLANGGAWVALAILLLKIKNHKLYSLIGDKHSEYEIKQWLFTAIPLWLRSYFIYLMNCIGILALEMLHLPEKEVGIFSAAFQITALITMWSTGISRYFFVLVAQHIEDKQKIQEFLNIRRKALLSIATPFVLLLVIFSKILLGMFGAEYIAGQTVFYILIFGYYSYVMTNFSVFILQIYGYHNFLIYSQLFFLVLLILLTFLLANFGGMVGAALGFMIPVVVMSVFYYLVVYFKFGLRVL